MGDLIDGNSTDWRTEKDFQRIKSVLDESKHSTLHVIGNHDLTLPGFKPRLIEKLNLTDPYYTAYVGNGFKIIILDGTDIFLNSYRRGSTEHTIALALFRDMKNRGEINALDFNGAIGSEQLSWFNNSLEDSRRASEKVIVICHFPILTEAATARHLLWNHGELLSLVRRYNDVVVSYFSGHFHKGGYSVDEGVHHLTLPAIVEAPDESNAFATVDVYVDRMEVRGCGLVESRTLLFKK